MSLLVERTGRLGIQLANLVTRAENIDRRLQRIDDRLARVAEKAWPKGPQGRRNG
jgi:hypothetical protein